MLLNKKTLLIGAAAAAALLALRGRARASVEAQAFEADGDRLTDAPPASERAPARQTGTGGQGKSVLTQVQEGTGTIAGGVATTIGKGIEFLGGLL